MARRPKPAGLESATDLARKMEILEREMATQRAALERLKQMGRDGEARHERHQPAGRGHRD